MFVPHTLGQFNPCVPSCDDTCLKCCELPLQFCHLLNSNCSIFIGTVTISISTNLLSLEDYTKEFIAGSTLTGSKFSWDQIVFSLNLLDHFLCNHSIWEVVAQDWRDSRQPYFLRKMSVHVLGQFIFSYTQLANWTPTNNRWIGRDELLQTGVRIEDAIRCLTSWASPTLLLENLLLWKMQTQGSWVCERKGNRLIGALDSRKWHKSLQILANWL